MDSVDPRYPADESVEEELITRMVITKVDCMDSNVQQIGLTMVLGTAQHQWAGNISCWDSCIFY